MSVTNEYSTGTSEGIEYADIRLLSRELSRIPREFQRAARVPLTAAGNKILQLAAVDSSWSSRIPHSLELRVSFSARRPGVSVRARLDIAPHARAYEGMVRDYFRHPVFGRMNQWVFEAARPFLLPAVREGQHFVIDAATEAVNEVSRRVGLV